MAIINRRSGLVHGGTKPFQPVVAQSWKGMQVMRNFSPGIMQIPSEDRAMVRALVTEFSVRFGELAPELRNLWEQYAAGLGSAVDREMGDNVSNAKNIIPKRRKLMSGIDAYIAANVNAALAGMATPLDTPPVGAGTPPPPLQVGLTYDNGIATATWIDPVLTGTPVAKFVRLWTHLHAGKRFHSQLVAHAALPSDGAKASFTEINGGNAWNSPKIHIADIPFGIVRVQMDTIIQPGASQAPMTGPASNVAEFSFENP
ncbi:MAG: hypothetical protein HY589_04170 [Candidatus Omnitrophica bacterium]|nr:hypothetical protein [Candidatus Omnitrophota bacterium]